MTTAAYDIRAERADLIGGWFRKHVATLTTYTAPDGKTIEHLVWAQPGTVTFRVDYVARGPYLYVTGDIGDATYCRAEGLGWWASLNLDYFASKCDASEHGRGYKSWDPDQARFRCEQHFATERSDAEKYGDRGDDVAERQRHFVEMGGADALHDENEWSVWLREHGHEAFGDDWWEFAMFGRVVDIRCAGHLEGLRLAMAQLKERAEIAMRAHEKEE